MHPKLIRYIVFLGVLAMKNKVLCAMLMALLGVLPSVASSSLLIHLTDGTEIVCSLAKEPQMLFGDKTITLTTLTGEIGEWNFSDVESWNFSDALDPDEEDGIQMVVEGAKLTASSEIAVYDLNGRQVNAGLKKNNGVFSVNLNGLPKGTYLVKVGKSCVKYSIR